MMLLRRVAFWCALVGLCALMMWPALKLPEAPIQRPDLIAHAGSFGAMTLLTVAARLWGPRSLSYRNVVYSGVLILAVSTLTEWAQGLPGINRMRSADDAFANAIGVVGAMIGCMVVSIARPGLCGPRA